MLRKKLGKDDKKDDKKPLVPPSQPQQSTLNKNILPAEPPRVAAQPPPSQSNRFSNQENPNPVLSSTILLAKLETTKEQDLQEKNIFDQIKKLVGARYEDAVILSRLKELKTVEAVISSLSAMDKNKDALLFKKLANVKQKDRIQVQYAPTLGLCKNNNRKNSCSSRLILDLQEIVDFSRYHSSGFTAETYV